MLGLVLTAGGARGAYQAGVLKRLSNEIETLIADSGALDRRARARGPGPPTSLDESGASRSRAHA